MAKKGPLLWILGALGALGLLAVIAVGAGIWFVASHLGMGVEAGDPAPAVRFTTPAGGTVALQDLEGKVVLLDFWASW